MTCTTKEPLLCDAATVKQSATVFHHADSELVVNEAKVSSPVFSSLYLSSFLMLLYICPPIPRSQAGDLTSGPPSAIPFMEPPQEGLVSQPGGRPLPLWARRSSGFEGKVVIGAPCLFSLKCSILLL